MIYTGIIRRVDDLGRVVIPREIRHKLNIKEGEPLEICLDGDMVCFKKYHTKAEVVNRLKDIIEFAKNVEAFNDNNDDNFSEQVVFEDGINALTKAMNIFERLGI